MGLAIITGGSRGLGAALCGEYRRRGWRVVEFSRSAPHPFSVRLDLSDTQAAARVFGETLERLSAGDVDEVVAYSNAAVLGPVGPVAGSAPELIASHLETNVVSAVLFARAFIGAFQERDCPKALVNVSSGAAVKGYAGWSLYCASKAAMENFVRSVALEQRAQRHPVRAISVNPGVMDTVMQAEVRASSPAEFPAIERFLALKAEGLLADPATVASRIADLVAARPEPGSVNSVNW